MKSTAHKTLKILLCIISACILTGVRPVHAAGITVTTTTDENVNNASCSLREAIIAANTNAAYNGCTSGVTGADIITLTSGSTYNLSLAGTNENASATGDLDILDSLTIQVSGATQAIIRQTIQDRILDMQANNISVILEKITVTNGYSPFYSPGGGISMTSSGQTLTISNSTVSNNTTTTYLQCGAGIYMNFAPNNTLNIYESTIVNNSCPMAGGDGAGLYIGNGTVNIRNSTFFANWAQTVAYGGPDYSQGGAIYLANGTLNISFSSFSNSRAQAGHGADIHAAGGTLNLSHSFLVNPISTTINCSSSATDTVTNNLIETNGGTDPCGTEVSTAFPYTLTLFSNGGPTQTLSTSTLANIYNVASDCTGSNNTDQRGVLRPQGAACDIGAYEMDATNPDVTVEQAAGQADPTGASPINFTATFSEPINVTSFTAADVTLGGTAGATAAVITQIAPNNGTAFNVSVSGMTTNGTVTALIEANKVQDAGGNNNNASTSADNTINFDTQSPYVTTTSLTASYNISGPDSFMVFFSEEVNNPTGNTDIDDVTNPANYLLIEKGLNDVVDTVSCAGGVLTDDVKITVSSIDYFTPPPSAKVNLAAPLSIGSYRLFICGTTSIVDLALTPLGGAPGTDFTFDFVITTGTPTSGSTTETVDGTRTKITASALPATGFAPNKVTSLPAQPATLEYANMGDLWLEIPSLNVKSNIVGVPQNKDKTWDVTWLGNDTGWLNGTAFPTWNGNSVLTAHVTNASGLDGPFAALKSLTYGDQIIIHMGGLKYVYEVRNTRLARPYSTNFAFESKQDASFLTLITCSGYNPLNESYLFRRVVRAVLIEVK